MESYRMGHPALRRSLARGAIMAKIGLFVGIAALVIGCLIAGAYFYVLHKSKGSPNEPIGNAQLYFYGDEDYREIATETLLLPDNTLLTIGTRSRDEDSPRKWDMVLLKTSLDGEQIQYKVIPGASSVRGTTVNDSFVFICSTTDRFKGTSAEYPVIRLLKINLDCDSLNSHIYDLGGEARTADIIPSSDDGLLLLARIKEGKSESRTPVLMKLDLNGDLVWTKTYPIELKTNYDKMYQTPDGGCIITGFRSYEDDLKETLRMFKVDSVGNILWKDVNEDLDCLVLDLVEMKGGNWMATGFQYAEDHSFDGRVLEFDADGRLIWNKSVGFRSSLYLTGLVPWVNGDYLIVGTLAIDNRFKFEKRRNWDTYYIALVTPDGDRMHSFHGERAVFQPWGVIPISEDYCVMTGFGGKYKKDEAGTISNQDIGLLHYRAN